MRNYFAHKKILFYLIINVVKKLQRFVTFVSKKVIL